MISFRHRVIHRRHGHGLRRVPGIGGERQAGRIHVRLAVRRKRDQHVGRRLRVQHHGIRVRGAAFDHLRRTAALRDRHTDDIVVRDIQRGGAVRIAEGGRCERDGLRTVLDEIVDGGDVEGDGGLSGRYDDSCWDDGCRRVAAGHRDRQGIRRGTATRYRRRRGRRSGGLRDCRCSDGERQYRAGAEIDGGHVERAPIDDHDVVELVPIPNLIDSPFQVEDAGEPRHVEGLNPEV